VGCEALDRPVAQGFSSGNNEHFWGLVDLPTRRRPGIMRTKHVGRSAGEKSIQMRMEHARSSLRWVTDTKHLYLWERPPWVVKSILVYATTHKRKVSGLKGMDKANSPAKKQTEVGPSEKKKTQDSVKWGGNDTTGKNKHQIETRLPQKTLVELWEVGREGWTDGGTLGNV